jgi:hypothetical protein
MEYTQQMEMGIPSQECCTQCALSLQTPDEAASTWQCPYFYDMSIIYIYILLYSADEYTIPPAMHLKDCALVD